MKIIKSDNIMAIDIDETLIMLKQKGGLPVKIGRGKRSWIAVKHGPHINEIKKFSARGHLVIAWSQGGYKWATKAIKALKLEPWVDIVMSKPKWCFDDKPFDQWSQLFYREFDSSERC